MFRRHRETIGALLATFLLVGLSIVFLRSLPTSSNQVQLLGVASDLPATTVVENGKQRVVFPPPTNVNTAIAEPRLTTVVQTARIEDTAQQRAPYTPPGNPSLQVELSIPISEMAQLKPEWSAHRVYRHGEPALVGATEESRLLARSYLDAFNQLRQEQHLPPLQWDTDLAARAEGYAATQLWYFLLDSGRSVSGSREKEIARYFGLQRDDFAPIWLDSHLAPTDLLAGTWDADAVLESLRGAGTGPSPYGPARLPVTRLGIGIAIAQNGEALIPHGWLVILFQ